MRDHTPRFSVEGVLARRREPNWPHHQVEGVPVGDEAQPTELGRPLFRQVRDYFRGDVASARSYYLEFHRLGFLWLAATVDRNQCNCHGTGGWLRSGEKVMARRLERFHAQDPAESWLYILDDDALTIVSGDSAHGPVRVPWHGDEPDWDKIENAFRDAVLPGRHMDW